MFNSSSRISKLAQTEKSRIGNRTFHKNELQEISAETLHAYGLIKCTPQTTKKTIPLADVARLLNEPRGLDDWNTSKDEYIEEYYSVEDNEIVYIIKSYSYYKFI